MMRVLVVRGQSSVFEGWPVWQAFMPSRKPIEWSLFINAINPFGNTATGVKLESDSKNWATTGPCFAFLK